MKIIKWLLKAAHEQPRKTSAIASSSTNKQEQCSAQSKEIVSMKKVEVEKITLGCSNFDLFANTSFYSTINLKSVHTMKMKKEDIVRGLGITINRGVDLVTARVGNTKVLPVSDVVVALSSNPTCGNEEKRYQKAKSDKTKTFSKMKELLKWAAAAKAEKGGKYISRKVLYFRNKATLKAVADDDHLSNESPKISFRWDMESYSIISSSDNSSVSMASSNSAPAPLHDSGHSITKAGNWITTDSEFVVLEF